METTQFKCSGNCIKCHPNQRQYCASQFTYNTMRMVEDMNKSMLAMQGTLEELTSRLDAIQGSEALLFNPTDDGQKTLFNADSEETTEETAQSGAGADE